MQTGTNTFNSYPIFPDWVFEGKLELDDNKVNAVIADIQINKNSNNYHETDFGWTTNKSVLMGQNVLNLNRLLGTMFVDKITSHFRISMEGRNIEICDSWFYGIKQNFYIPLDLHRHRWYHSVIFLNCDENSSSLYFSMQGPKLYCSPPGIQNYDHIIKPEKNKIIFFPAHIPWGFTPNKSSNPTIVFCNSFVNKKM